MKHFTILAIALASSSAFAQVNEDVVACAAYRVAQAQSPTLDPKGAASCLNALQSIIPAVPALPPPTPPAPPNCVPPTLTKSPYIGGPLFQKYVGEVDFVSIVEINEGRISRTRIDNIQFYPHTDSRWNYSRLRDAADEYLAKWKCTGTGTFTMKTNFRWN